MLQEFPQTFNLQCHEAYRDSPLAGAQVAATDAPCPGDAKVLQFILGIILAF
jgi:hypothetical protein